MRAIGIVLAGGNSKRMRELSNKRAVAAMPVAGSYRSIDFALSNMTNSHIQNVAVFTQYNSRSLNLHLSSSKWWDFGRKQGYPRTPSVPNIRGMSLKSSLSQVILMLLEYLLIHLHLSYFLKMKLTFLVEQQLCYLKYVQSTFLFLHLHESSIF